MEAQVEKQPNGRQTTAYPERQAEDLEQVVDDLEPVDNEEDARAIINIVERLDGELRDEVNATNHFRAPIRNINNPETTALSTEDGTLQLSGEEFGQVGQVLEEYADIQNVQYWLATEENTYEEETRNDNGEHLSIENANWTEEDLASRLEGFKLEIDGETYTPEEARELSDALDIRSANNFFDNIEIPRMLVQYETIEEVLEGEEQYSSEEEIREDLETAREAGLITSGNNLTLKGVLQSNDMEARDLRSLETLSDDESVMDSHRLHTNPFFAKHGELDSAEVRLDYSVEHSTFDTLMSDRETGEIDYQSNSVSENIERMAAMIQDELGIDLDLKNDQNHTSSYNVRDFLEAKIGVRIPEDGIIDLDDLDSQLEDLASNNQDPVLDISYEEVKERLIEDAMSYGGAQLSDVSLEVEDVVLSDNEYFDSDSEAIAYIKESVLDDGGEIGDLFKAEISGSKIAVNSKISQLNTYSSEDTTSISRAFRDSDRNYQQFYETSEAQTVAKLDEIKAELLPFDIRVSAGKSIYIDEHIHGREELEETINDLESREHVDGGYSRNQGTIEITADSELEFARARNLLDRIPEDARSQNHEEWVQTKDRVKEIYTVSTKPEHAEEVLEELEEYMDILEDERLTGYGNIIKEGPAYEARPSYEQSHRNKINETIDLLVEEADSTLAKGLRKIFPDPVTEEYTESDVVLDGWRDNYISKTDQEYEPDIPQELEDKIVELYDQGKLEFEVERRKRNRATNHPNPNGEFRINYSQTDDELLEQMGELEEEGIIDIDSPQYKISYDDSEVESFDIKANYRAEAEEVQVDVDEEVEAEVDYSIGGPVEYRPDQTVRNLASPLNPLESSNEKYEEIEVPTNFQAAI